MTDTDNTQGAEGVPRAGAEPPAAPPPAEAAPAVHCDACKVTVEEVLEKVENAAGVVSMVCSVCKQAYDELVASGAIGVAVDVAKAVLR